MADRLGPSHGLQANHCRATVGRQFRLLNVLDDFNRERLRIPGSSGQGFRFDPATHSNLIRSPIPGHPATPSG